MAPPFFFYFKKNVISWNQWATEYGLVLGGVIVSLCSDLSLTKRCHTQISCCMHAFFVLIMSFSVHSLLCSAWAGHLFLRCSNHHIWHLCSLLRSVKKALSYLSVFEFHVILCLEVVCITEWVYLKKSPLSARSPVAADACCSLPSAFSAAC